MKICTAVFWFFLISAGSAAGQELIEFKGNLTEKADMKGFSYFSGKAVFGECQKNLVGVKVGDKIILTSFETLNNSIQSDDVEVAFYQLLFAANRESNLAKKRAYSIERNKILLDEESGCYSSSLARPLWLRKCLMLADWFRKRTTN